MFLEKRIPQDFDCGLNLELMIEALPRITDEYERIDYAKRIVGLIKQSHINWVDADGTSKKAWDFFFKLSPFDLQALGIRNPFETGEIDDAR